MHHSILSDPTEITRASVAAVARAITNEHLATNATHTAGTK